MDIQSENATLPAARQDAYEEDRLLCFKLRPWGADNRILACRSALAAVNLQKMGFRNVISLAGGYRGWREGGNPGSSAKPQ